MKNGPRVCVVDASVVLKWVLAETGRVSAAALLDDYEAGRAHLLAPPTLIHEIASALTRQFRRKLLDEHDALTALEFLKLRLPLMPKSDLASKATSLALQHYLSYWDALYVALAMEYRCDLITADARLHRVAVKHYPYVELLRA